MGGEKQHEKSISEPGCAEQLDNERTFLLAHHSERPSQVQVIPPRNKPNADGGPRRPPLWTPRRASHGRHPRSQHGSLNPLPRGHGSTSTSPRKATEADRPPLHAGTTCPWSRPSRGVRDSPARTAPARAPPAGRPVPGNAI